MVAIDKLPWQRAALIGLTDVKSIVSSEKDNTYLYTGSSHQILYK